MARHELVEIELGDIESVAQLHARLMVQLRFPDWYGTNWDAFWDAITGLVEMPLVLRLKNWKEFERRFPSDANVIANCLENAARQYPSFASRIERA